MQGASHKSSSLPCSHAGLGGDASSCLSLSPCKMLPGLRAFPSMQGGKTTRLSPTSHLHGYPRGKVTCPTSDMLLSRHRTPLQQMDATPEPQLMAVRQYSG